MHLKNFVQFSSVRATANRTFGSLGRSRVRKVAIAGSVGLLSLHTFAAPTGGAEPALTAMPRDLETRYALSAAPPAIRDQADVYLLDPGNGYYQAIQGKNGIACLVERTVWEMVDFRDDIFIPLCYDAAGTTAHLRVIMDTASLRAQGMDAPSVKAEIERRYTDKTYGAPERAGLSYMVAPVMRAPGPPDLHVHTMAMPHFMFYAPYITNADIGALPNLSDPASLANPFIDRQGNSAQSYMIQMVGAAEKTRILELEKSLVTALCEYRKALCLSGPHH